MTEPTPVAAPAVPPTPAYAPPPPTPRRALGATGFVLSLLAFLGDFVVAIVLLATFISAIGNLVGYLQGQDAGAFGAAAAAFVAAILAGIAGTLLAVVGIVLGCIAAARNRGRVLGVFAIVLGGLVIVTRILLLVGIATNGNGGS
jgi:hypothetical protein